HLVSVPELVGADNAIWRRRDEVALGYVSYLCCHSSLLVGSRQAAPARRTKNSSLFTCLDAGTEPWFTVPVYSSGLRFCLAHLRIINFDSGPIFECLQDLVTAGDDFIVFFETVFHLDISGAGQASVHFAKFSLVRRGYYEHALNFVGILLHLRDRSSLAGFALAALRFKIF